MDERQRRAGENEALFREVNERIEDVNRAFSALTDRMEVVCECGRGDCAQRISLPLAEYERVRSEPTAFVLVEGHDDPEVERVVERGDGWVVVRKFGEGPAGLARETDPRS